MKELEELKHGEERESLPLPLPLPFLQKMETENLTCKCCYPSRNMENEHAKWKFEFRREEKYCYASQATLQMNSNEFRIIPWYSYNNNITTTGPSNLFISQKVSQTDGGTRRNWNCCRMIHMLNLGQHPITKIPIPSMPTFKQYLTAIQLQSRSHFVYPSHLAQGSKDIWKIT